MHSSCQSPMLSFLQHLYGNNPAGRFRGMGQLDLGFRTHLQRVFLSYAMLNSNLQNVNDIVHNWHCQPIDPLVAWRLFDEQFCIGARSHVVFTLPHGWWVKQRLDHANHPCRNTCPVTQWWLQFRSIVILVMYFQLKSARTMLLITQGFDQALLHTPWWWLTHSSQVTVVPFGHHSADVEKKKSRGRLQIPTTWVGKDVCRSF